MGDGQSNVGERSAEWPGCYRLCRRRPVGLGLGPTRTGAVESHRAHQGQEHGRIVLMACSQGQDQWLAHAVGAQVHLGTESAATASQAFVLVRRSGRAGRVLVGLNRCAIDEVLVPIQLAALLGQLL